MHIQLSACAECGVWSAYGSESRTLAFPYQQWKQLKIAYSIISGHTENNNLLFATTCICVSLGLTHNNKKT